MALIDDIEFYGRAVDAGDMTHTDAVRLLTQNSNGGLTEAGAAHQLAEWTTARTGMAALIHSTAQQYFQLLGY